MELPCQVAIHAVQRKAQDVESCQHPRVGRASQEEGRQEDGDTEVVHDVGNVQKNLEAFAQEVCSESITRGWTEVTHLYPLRGSTRCMHERTDRGDCESSEECKCGHRCHTLSRYSLWWLLLTHKVREVMSSISKKTEKQLFSGRSELEAGFGRSSPRHFNQPISQSA